LALKRALDITVAVFGLPLLLPVFVGIALVVWIDSPGPVLFKLRVAGCGGKAFTQWKFRTMIKDARREAHPFETSATDWRITRAGRFLRRWALDELPQLWNIFRGEMSLVGPRPTFIEVASLYPPQQARRLEMRPGLTGLAQVQGRNLIPWPQRVALDLIYIEHFSFWMDCKVLLATIPLLVRGTGVYSEDGSVRMQHWA
jgi:lipopolysaccharide/colanic/teichoic acid biosynthesis glycosyltransferase